MNFVNRAMGGLFDVILTPFELIGAEVALVLMSGIFGVLCLVCFKQISSQKGIKSVKDKIKGNMIAIRLYQDDLAIVSKSVASVLLRNFQYIGLNFGPLLPFFPPFALVLAQFVVRYAYDPLPVVSVEEYEEMLSGEGTMVTITMKDGDEARVADLEVVFPEGIRVLKRFVPVPAERMGYVEIAAVEPVQGEIEFRLSGQTVGVKEIVAGDDPTRKMQPTATASFWAAWLFPAEDTFAADSPLADVSFTYPTRDLAFWVLPDGEAGILLVFFLGSIVFGIAVLKPLNIQI